MVSSKHFAYWLLLLVGICAVSSCTNILGIDTDYVDNPCASGPAQPPLKCGEGACRVLVDACDADGLPVTECKAGEPKETDTCGDSIDNDCDGSVDENDTGTCTCQEGEKKACYTGTSATRNKGVCVDGTQTCLAGTWGQCQGDVLPDAEKLNDLDDDCDGDVDEGLPCDDGATKPCYGGADGTINEGPCKQGTQTCKNGTWQKCTNQTVPVPETCNGFDDDCDGDVDDIGAEGSPCECGNGVTQPCYVNAMGNPIPCPDNLLGTCKCGEQTCGNGKFGACIGAVLPSNSDLCDGVKDEDCNGIVDNIGDGPCECLTGSTQPCYNGDIATKDVGKCKSGTQLCNNGKWGPCNGQQLPTNEVCDGTIDDDCNGVIDNINLPNSPCECLTGSTQQCYTGPVTTLGLGTCIPGTQSCNTGKWGTCNGQKLPTLEICDGLDNDCNGLPDDGVPGVGDPCFLPQYANTPCHGGTLKCQIGDSVPKCVTNVTPGSVLEDCDGVDDNCDGLVDNGLFCCPGDGKTSGNETDLDCGGSCAIKCEDNKKCIVGIDCTSGNCFQSLCKSATCNDKVQNGGEPDVDCGLVCPNKCLVGQSCNVDSDCISNLCQAANKKCIQKGPGDVCATNEECSTGYCVDNVCCNTACNGVCQACTTAKKGGGTNGFCGPVADNTDPDSDCDLQEASTCQNTGVCVGGNCAKYAAGTQCQTATCTGPNTENQADTCDGLGACVPKNEKDCSPYACVSNGCKSSCVTDGECANGNFCETPQCQPKRQAGANCTAANQCLSGSCVDGVCCLTNCAGTCLACNIPGSLGTCTAITANQDPANECNPGSCDGGGQCQKSNGASCSNNAQCVSGNCVDGVCCNTTCVGTCLACSLSGSVGTCTNIPANADPDSECNPGACNGLGDCQGVVATTCTQPSDCASGFCVDGYCCNEACTGACEACSGLVKGEGQNGTCGPIKAGLDPASECNPGACNGAKACQSNNGASCTQNSQCASGNCVDGVCCNLACTGSCQACNVQNNVGTCVNIPGNQDPANECNPGSCNGLGQCQVDLGAPCSSADQCTSGFCADGVCCNAACSGLCQACTTALKGTGINGECGAIIAGTDPQNECGQQGVDTCGRTGFCDGGGACELYTNGTVCQTASCTGNTKVNPDTCNGMGLCQDGGSMSCGAYACNGGQCEAAPCTNDAQCATGNFCDLMTSTCKPKLAAGATCSGANECSTNFCIDGVCCLTTCTDECKSCAVPGNLGTCTNVPSGQPDANPACQGVQVCNGSGKCVDTNGQPCAANSECLTQACVDGVCCNNACLGTCNACSTAKTGGTNGVCTPIPNGQDPDGECTGAATCNGANGCTLLATGTACSTNAECATGACVDGFCCENACAGACKACSAAKTNGMNGACLNVAADTDPDNDCALAECNGAGACEVADGAACTLPSQCANGNCVDGVCCNNACNGACVQCNKAGAIGTCSPVAPGQQDQCAMGSVCDAGGACKKTAGVACSLNDECQSGNCVDGVCCTTACGGTCQACNLMAAQGTCTNITAGMDPANECPGADVCNGAGACAEANGSPCVGNGECLSGQCVDGVCCENTCPGTCKACNVAGSLGTCTNIPFGTDPASECSGPGVCDGAGGCKKGLGESCGGNVDCASNFCVDNVCCNVACNGTCEACTAALTNGADGTCAPVKANAESNNECPIGECNGAGVCEVDLGATCTQDSQCASGSCVDGVCCNTACSGTCEACNVMAAQGTCTSVPADTDPANECAADCNGAGACELANGGGCTLDAQCGSGICIEEDGVCCDTACNGLCEACSAAKTGGTNGVCAPIKSGDDPESECAGSLQCNGAGACELGNGAACADGTECESGFCVDNICCDAACNGTCEACSAAKTGGTDGTCSFVKVNTDLDNECPGAADCNGAGACELPNGAGTCTQGSQCVSGSCAVQDSVCCDNTCDGTCMACLIAKTGVASGTCANVLTNQDPDTECMNGECTGAGICEKPDGDPCTANNECQNGYCNGTTCATPTCTDGVQNGTETDRDCGGSCPACTLILLAASGNGTHPATLAAGTGAWTTGSVIATTKTDAPLAVAMQGPAAGVGLVRDTDNTNNLRYLTWVAGTGWSTVTDVDGNAVDTAPTLASAPGLAHASYRRSGKLYAAQWNGTAWSSVDEVHTLVGGTNAALFPFTAASLGNGDSFMSYLEFNTGSMKHDVFILARVGGTWQSAYSLELDASLGIQAPAVALTTGEILVVFGETAGGNQLSFRRRDTAGSWQSVGTIPNAIYASNSRLSLAALPNGDAVLAFKRSSDNTPCATFFNGTTKTWSTTVTQVSSTTMANSISVARGLMGQRAELVFVDSGSGVNAKVLHSRHNGTSWSATPTQVGSNGNYSQVAIAAPPL
ncbi:MopE-related protein [Polyangium sp. 15x6]|uniref:MopE-related protein n=1 Tax=Polyangium sp. 15x6 TaxID=3042687 RepID=UPI00249C0B66|nr:MopE-related protein [Polyangium sp. 15x6]MDI3291309.1 MopE-related protein [Polyangium sp. 15x6]